MLPTPAAHNRSPPALSEEPHSAIVVMLFSIMDI
jgi:hypothetical protein